ncbi:MAG: iron-sulfur cluster assembly accessory protein [Rhodospirillaceae bacterium]|nr:iron-sulfur cluster assembly accessory protein [Rhodospirillales bacterium]
MLTVTDRAVAAIKSVRENDTQGLRVMVASGGCSGLKYSLGLVNESSSDDEVLEFGDVKVFVDPSSVMWLTGAVMDFVNAGSDAGFIFENPNTGDKCSCSGGSC